MIRGLISPCITFQEFLHYCRTSPSPMLEDCFGNLLKTFSTLAAQEKFTVKISP
jgi:hypothetical protein